MKKLLLTAMLLCAGAGIFAQSKLNPTARFMIHEMKMYPSRDGSSEIVSALVKIKPGCDSSVFQIEDVKVITCKGQFATIAFPLELAEKVAAIPEVVSVSFGEKLEPLMDKARPASFVNKLQQGTSNGFSQNYSGKGILLGMMDQGLDPNHINFFNTDLTQNRIIGLTTILGEDATTKNYAPDEILDFTTENDRSSHATHVAGIMGGGYKGIGLVAVGKNVEEDDVPFYGVAPNAEIYPCVGDLFTPNIITAAHLFADKVKELGKPGVFNLSVGYVPGPHDGTSDINEALAEVGKDVIICVAAGNDGESAITLQNDFSQRSELKTVIGADSEGNWVGAVDTWSDNADVFSMTFVMIDKATGTVKDKIEIPYPIPSGSVFEVSASLNPNATFTAAFNGKMQVTSGVSPQNNRFNVYVSLSISPKTGSKIVPALIFTGSGNTKINSFVSGGMSFSNSAGDMFMPGYMNGNANQSINNIACGENIIAVGAYTTKTEWPVLSGVSMKYTASTQVGEVAPFSSYGSLFGPGGATGKTLPEICAPGFGVVSSLSQYYVDKEGLGDEDLSANVTTTVNVSKGSRDNQYGIMAGTSMATPYVSGTIALLLEADPTLKVDDVRDLLTATAIGQNQTGTVATQWGAGKLNADDAMRKLLGMTSEIGNINADTNRRFAVSFYPGGVQAIVAGEKSVTARLYSLAGALVASAAGAGDSVNISTESLPKGVYVLTVITPEGVKVSKNLLINAN
ncbi:MAG: S8 family serine peptidase [Bacteroides sp.]|nr:S8 family serine peptidase [Bacteroides sp.]